MKPFVRPTKSDLAKLKKPAERLDFFKGDKDKIDFSWDMTEEDIEKEKKRRKREKQRIDRMAERKTKDADKQLRTGRRVVKSNLTSEDKLHKRIDLLDVYKQPETEPLDEAVLAKVLPKGIGKATASKVTELINLALEDIEPVLGIHFRDNCVAWSKAVTATAVTAEQYINAVKFVTHKLAGESTIVAYAKTFPDRVSRMSRDGMTNEALATYAAIYSRGKIVTEIHALALVPAHIMYQDYFHMAVKTQVEIMTDAGVSPKVRSDAANSLLTHLKTPEVKKAELDITLKETDTISELRDVMNQLSRTQVKGVQDGEYQVIDVSNHKLLNSNADDEEVIDDEHSVQ